MSEAVIQAEGLGKRYRVGERERYFALRDVLARAFTAPFRNGNGRQKDYLWALKDVSFEVKQGEVIGLIGRNGAGKSTLLKILARVTKPTAGWAEVRGRVGSLLEVGTGFHPELTGRENVFLSGAILGMKRAEILKKFDEIVAFAETERFLDTPLKHYSSGMQIRLAFAVAAHLEPEILLVDEVLAVGDLSFQKKCLGKMGDVAKTGRTIVFVSHQMNQIRRLCDQVYWVDGGRIREAGGTAQIVSRYEQVMASGKEEKGREGEALSGRGGFMRWEIVDSTPELPCQLSTLGPTTVRFLVKVARPIQHGHHGVALRGADGQLIWAWAANDVELEPGISQLRYTFPILPIRPGVYTWHVSLYEDGELVDAWECKPDMIVATEDHQHARDEWNGVLNVPCKFAVGQASVET